MLLDAYALKSTFSHLLPSPAPAGFTKRLATTMARLDSLLKTLQVRPSPPEALVQAYLIHISDRSDSNFRKVLDLKGVRKADQPHLLELFQLHRAGPQHKDLQANSPLLTPLLINASASGAGAMQGLGMQGMGMGIGIGSLSSSVAAASISTASLPGRFDPSTLGSAIMSAARDSVDRLGSPALGASAGSGTTTPSVQAPALKDGGTGEMGGSAGVGGNMSENLRNIGKFFKRDLGGFGGRFGGG
jgi:vacuolar protein sorting-associated protein 53